MRMRYCENCKKETAHKRNLGVGTIIAIFLTLGLWLFVIPFYPQRCIICGNPKLAEIDQPKSFEGKLIYNGLFAVVFISILIYGIFFKDSGKSTEQPKSVTIQSKENEPKKNPCGDKGSPEMQQERKKFISESISKRIVIKISEENDKIICYVDKGFYLLNYEQKKVVMDAILSYYYCKPPYIDRMIILDGYTNKYVGGLSKAVGFHLK